MIKSIEELVPAATVVLVRDAPAGLEVLMLERNAEITFGGMWVFPGGRVDPADRVGTDVDGDNSTQQAARAAAARETLEEAGLRTEPEAFIPFSHWEPPRRAGRRYSTWFFIAEAPTGAVTVDGGEIADHHWVAPSEALRGRDSGRLRLVPPTWVTLHRLSRAVSVADALVEARERPPSHFRTRMVQGPEALVAVWEPDPAHTTGDLDEPGPYRRLVMSDSGWRWEGERP